MKKKWMVRSSDDSACRCVIEAETRFEALSLAEAKLGIPQDKLIAGEWMF